jgi:hypothetical protein
MRQVAAGWCPIRSCIAPLALTPAPCWPGTSSPITATSTDARTGSTVIGRLREMGYIRRGDIWVVGENLYWWTADRSTAGATVEAWMESAIHRKYLLNPKFEELGVGAQHGIPYDPTQTDGITVAAEFGFRRAP